MDFFYHRGIYLLEVRLLCKERISIGCLGDYSFAPGFYYYSGSAWQGLESRLRRHLREEKPLYWHIDYLLEYGRVERIFVWPHERERECSLATGLLDQGLEMPVTGFGASDCSCNTHLFYSPASLEMVTLLAEGKEIVIEQ